MTSPDAYELLRDQILEGRRLPNERLVEAELADAYGVGRAAIRTALVRLAHEGLVEHERNRGARVRLVPKPEAIEILEVRSVLEAVAARHAAERITEAHAARLREVLAGMRARLDAEDLLGASGLNAVLHATILEASGHHTARRLVSTLSSQLVRFQYRTILVPGRSQRSYAEHSAIVEAVVAGRGDAAERAMREHLDRVGDALRASPESGA